MCIIGDMNLAISYAMEMIASVLAPLKKSVEPMPWAEVILDREIFECVRISQIELFFLRDWSFADSGI